MEYTRGEQAGPWLLLGAVWWELQCCVADICSVAGSEVSEGWTGNATVASGLGT